VATFDSTDSRHRHPPRNKKEIKVAESADDEVAENDFNGSEETFNWVSPMTGAKLKVFKRQKRIARE
jgi:hypothetical protein